MTANAPAGTGKDRFDEETAGWKDIVRKYQQPSKRKGAWQLVNTLGPYIGLWVGMYFAMSVSWWLVIPMAILAGGFLVRTFIIFHDCTHGSFFRSKRANEITGIITGFLVFTPFHIWRWEHTVHHASAGDLDRRGIGDVWTLTVKEYLESSRWRRFAYRLSRNPIVLFLIAPLTLFLIIQRFPVPKAGKREQLWLLYTNIALLAFVVGLALVYGLIPYLIIQLTVMGFATTAGVWLFYVQHQFEDAYWERRPDWDYAKAALEGSSFYKLPKILQWFSGNIGFHHIHHLSPRIPNYHLERAHNSEPMFRNIKPLTVRTSIKSLNYRLWDEDRQKLIGYKGLKALPRRKA
ncbi:MAG TPA: fatty acid desaturase [Luteolibacter sp.]|nr:fatty acid desaturase [Luteolibacter sp.]